MEGSNYWKVESKWCEPYDFLILFLWESFQGTAQEGRDEEEQTHWVEDTELRM